MSAKQNSKASVPTFTAIHLNVIETFLSNLKLFFVMVELYIQIQAIDNVITIHPQETTIIMKIHTILSSLDLVDKPADFAIPADMVQCLRTILLQKQANTNLRQHPKNT